MELARYLPDVLLRHLQAYEETPPSFLRLHGMVVVVDIVNSTGITEHFVRSGPDGGERLGALLNEYFGRAFEIVERHGGDVLRIDGDAMVLFWAQAEGITDVASSLAAALALRDTFAGWRPQAGVVFGQRLTIAYGAMVGMLLGSEAAPRSFAFAGAPMREIAVIGPQGGPDEITVCESAVGLLEKTGKTMRGSDGVVRLLGAQKDAAGYPVSTKVPSGEPATLPIFYKDFLPRLVIDRETLGEGVWFAEFRIISMAQIRIDGLDERSSNLDRLYNAVEVTRRAALAAGAAVTDIVDSDKGLVVKCVWGLPSSTHDNNAAHAVDGARRIAAMLAGAGLSAGIGVSTGAAFCGDVGSARRREYRSVGTSPAYAARLMQAASDAILVDGATAKAAGSYFRFTGPRLYQLKGRADPMPVYQLAGLMYPPVRTTPFAAVPPLVGRDTEADLVTNRLIARSGELILIEGEAGSGKSRLLTHVLRLAEAQELKMVGIALSPIEQMTVYAALQRLLLQLLLGIADPSVIAPDRLGQRIDDLLADSELLVKAPLLEDILGAGIAQTPFATQISGVSRRNSLEELVIHLIEKVTSGQPIAIYIDDAHWLDASSAEMLIALERRLPKLTVIATMRPLAATAPPKVGELREDATVKIDLQPLSRDAIEQLACVQLGVTSIPERLAEYLFLHSHGVPLHAEQLILSLKERGIVAVSEGWCRAEIERLSADGASHELHDVIVSRLDRLDPEAQFVAKVASVTGRLFSRDLLSAVHPVTPPAPSLDGSLAILVDAKILEHATVPDATHFAFRHGVIQEVVYELLTFAQRRILHRQMAQYIERFRSDALEPHYAEVAEHWERADEGELAIRYHELAADSALRRYANYDALAQVERLERLAERVGSELPRKQLARLARLRGDAYQELARFDEAQHYLRKCAELSGIGIPTTRLGLSMGFVSEIARQIKHRTLGPKKAAVGATMERERLAAHIHMRLAEHAYFAGDALGVMHGTLASLNLAERSEATTEVTVGYGGIAIALGIAGQHGLARYYGARSIAQAKRGGILHDEAIANLLVAVYAFPAGNWAEADEHCLKGAELFGQVGDVFRRQTCEVIRAYARIATGRYDDAERILAPFGEDCEKVDNASVKAWVACARAMLDRIRNVPSGISVRRLSAGWDESLHSGEKLLWSGMMATTLLHLGDAKGAEQAAGRALDNMRANAPTIGVAYASIPAVAEVWLALARQAAAEGRPYDGLMAQAETTCRLIRPYAAKTRIALPRVRLVTGRLASLKGRPRAATKLVRRAMHDAEVMSMPLEVSMCLDALAELEGNDRGRMVVS